MEMIFNTLLLGLICTVAESSATSEAVNYLQQEYDICQHEYAPVSIYLPRPDDFVDVYVSWTYGQSIGHPAPCEAHIQTCDHCHIRATAIEPFVAYPKCWSPDIYVDRCVSRCVYMFLYDDEYMNEEQDRISTIYDGYEFTSQSKNLHVLACGNQAYPMNITMKLRLSSLKKVRQIVGDEFTFTPMRTINSPYFPKPYVRNSEYYTFKFQGLSRPPRNLLITISFDDWLISPSSTIQFEGVNIINKINGENIRPYIISNGHSLTMTFYTGEAGKLDNRNNLPGFKAVATFYNNRLDIPNIETDCDRFESKSGGIMHLSASADGRNRDCIWIIKKVSGFDGVYLKVLRFKTRSARMNVTEFSLEIRGGLTSTTDQRLLLRPNEFLPSNTVQLSENGFYVRLKGSYYTDDSLLIAYAMYKDDCDDYRVHYKCDNGRCIPERLKCDTYDHCGDGSDEIRSMCGRIPSKLGSEIDEFSTNHVSNSSAQNESYSIGVYVIIPLGVSVIVFIGLICLFVIMFKRCHRLRNATFGRYQTAHPRQIRGHRRNGVQMSVTLSSGEHPPAYEDVIRSTPFRHLNMAFSWTACEDTFSQPPSYEEAVSSATAPVLTNDSICTNSANSQVCSMVDLTATQQHPPQRVPSFPSLETQPEASPPSSSENFPDIVPINFTLACCSSTQTGQSQIPNRCKFENVTSTSTIDKDSRYSNPESCSKRKFTPYRNKNCAVLNSENSENNIHMNENISGKSKELYRNGNIAGRQEFNENATRYRNLYAQKDEDHANISKSTTNIREQGSTDEDNVTWKMELQNKDTDTSLNRSTGIDCEENLASRCLRNRFLFHDQMVHIDGTQTEVQCDSKSQNMIFNIWSQRATDCPMSQRNDVSHSDRRRRWLMGLQGGCSCGKPMTAYSLDPLFVDDILIKDKLHNHLHKSLSSDSNYSGSSLTGRRHGNEESDGLSDQKSFKLCKQNVPLSRKDNLDNLKHSMPSLPVNNADNSDTLKHYNAYPVILPYHTPDLKYSFNESCQIHDLQDSCDEFCATHDLENSYDEICTDTEFSVSDNCNVGNLKHKYGRADNSQPGRANNSQPDRANNSQPDRAAMKRFQKADKYDSPTGPRLRHDQFLQTGFQNVSGYSRTNSTTEHDSKIMNVTHAPDTMLLTQGPVCFLQKD